MPRAEELRAVLEAAAPARHHAMHHAMHACGVTAGMHLVSALKLIAWAGACRAHPQRASPPPAPPQGARSGRAAVPLRWWPAGGGRKRGGAAGHASTERPCCSAGVAAPRIQRLRFRPRPSSSSSGDRARSSGGRARSVGGRTSVGIAEARERRQCGPYLDCVLELHPGYTGSRSGSCRDAVSEAVKRGRERTSIGGRGGSRPLPPSMAGSAT